MGGGILNNFDWLFSGFTMSFDGWKILKVKIIKPTFSAQLDSRLHFDTLNVLTVVWMWPAVVQQDFPFSCVSTARVFTTTQLYREWRKQCYICIITVVLAIPVLKHWLLILSNTCRSSLPAGIPPRVWAVGWVSHLNTINGPDSQWQPIVVS